jgi:predicted ATPase/class 3 adenylate cyclase
VPESSPITTFLFTDIEGSTRLWEQEPVRMRDALAAHDALARACVAQHRGSTVKSTGDGMLAVFADPLDSVNAALQFQLALADPGETGGLQLRVRCGLHAGAGSRRDGDFYGNAVNRAARIMSAAHGGQILLSQAVAALVNGRLTEGVSLRDLGSVRLRDLAEPERLHQVLHPRLREQFPALRSLEATPNNLPRQLTPFVAREREFAEVRTLLGNARLLTLLGGGGFGKTRLSLQVAADALDDYPDGVWLVELAPITDPRLVAQTVASVLGVKEEPGYSVLDALLGFARDRRFLLVFDNCEHVVQACAEFARLLLEAAPGVTILASSREALNVRGERAYPLAPLPVPSPSPTLRADAIESYAAVQLFADRAAAARPSFRITDDNAAAVAEICHRLDGIPLALELAAARLRTLSVEAIASRLTDRFRLLSGGDRTAQPRQQTLRALIDWSHDLLEEQERVLFRRLAVFAGGFTLDAAESVGAGGELVRADVLDLLARLVEKSLVLHDADQERYRMLETVRQYAYERLRDAGDGDAAREGHLSFYLAYAEQARSKIYGPDQGIWLRNLDRERENLLSAHAACDTARDGAVRGLQIASATKAYWILRGLLHLGHRIIAEALARPGAQARDHARCRALFDLGQFDYMSGDFENARAHLEDSLAIAREIAHRNRIAATLQPLGMVMVAQKDLSNARACLEEAVVLAREQDLPREIAAALIALAQLHRLQGALDAAEPLYLEALALSRKLGDRTSIAISLLNLAMVAISRGKVEAAPDMLRETIAITLEVGSEPLLQSVLDVAAGLAAQAGRWDRTARLLGAAEAIVRRLGFQRDAADAEFLRPLAAQARAALGAVAYAEAEAGGAALAHDAALAEVRAEFTST